MTIHTDQKGKVFTEVVTKDHMPALIQTVTHLIQGHIHVHRSTRLLDELNRLQRFVPVTRAVVLDSGGKELYRTGFLALNVSQIVWVYAQEEGGQPNSQQHGDKTEASR